MYISTAYSIQDNQGKYMSDITVLLYCIQCFNYSVTEKVWVVIEEKGRKAKKKKERRNKMIRILLYHWINDINQNLSESLLIAEDLNRLHNSLSNFMQYWTKVAINVN